MFRNQFPWPELARQQAAPTPHQLAAEAMVPISRQSAHMPPRFGFHLPEPERAIFVAKCITSDGPTRSDRGEDLQSFPVEVATHMSWLASIERRRLPSQLPSPKIAALAASSGTPAARRPRTSASGALQLAPHTSVPATAPQSAPEVVRVSFDDSTYAGSRSASTQRRSGWSGYDVLQSPAHPTAANVSGLNGDAFQQTESLRSSPSQDEPMTLELDSIRPVHVSQALMSETRGASTQGDSMNSSCHLRLPVTFIRIDSRE
jgi:hypothetical protein